METYMLPTSGLEIRWQHQKLLGEKLENIHIMSLYQVCLKYITESSSLDICFYLYYTTELLQPAIHDNGIKNITFFYQDAVLSSTSNHLRITSSDLIG